MDIQLSSGQGPVECELAVGKLLQALTAEYPGIEVLEKVPGSRTGCWKSVRLRADRDLSHLEGTVKWVCQSPYRPRHKRKNWFVDVSLWGEAPRTGYDPELVRFDTFRSGGKGGQHVNKVETGVRAVYLPTGLAVVSTQARSQQRNKQLALDRLCALLAEQNARDEAALRACQRLEHTRLERGGAVRTYQGMEFLRVG